MSNKYANFIPETSNELMEKFINYIMLDGKKTVARRIFRDALEEVGKKTKQDPISVFEKAIGNIRPAMEVRPKRIGGAVYQIPLEVPQKRALSLAFRWLKAAARSKKGAPMYKILADELIAAANEEGAAVKKKEDSHKMAKANKAFAHFARY